MNQFLIACVDRIDAQLAEYNEKHPHQITVEVISGILADKPLSRKDQGKDFVVVADSGLMSEKNVRLLRSAGYKYIVGARIKSEYSATRDWILSLEKKGGVVYECRRSKGDRLIVGYSSGRLPMMQRTGPRAWRDWRSHTSPEYSPRQTSTSEELERIIKLCGIGMSVDKVIDIAKTISSIDIKTDGVIGTARRTLFLTDEQKIIQPLFDLEKLVRRFG